MKNLKAKYLNIFIAFPVVLTFLLTTNILAAGFASRVADIYPGTSNSDPQYLAVFNSKLYFAANGGDGAGTELWVYDGSNPPSRVADIRSGVNSSYPQYLVGFNNKLYFAANGGVSGTELWVYDGNNIPSIVADISLGVSSSDPQYLVVFNSKLHFAANGGDGAGIELWVYDGSNPPNRVADIYSGVSNSYPRHLAVFNNKLYFSADGGDSARTELWVYDGSNAPSRVADIRPGVSSSYPQFLTVFNSKLYFAANGGDSAGRELWVYDGSNAPSRNADIWSGGDSSDPQHLAVFNNKLYFSADGGDGAGREFWVFDGSNAPNRDADIWSGGDSSDPQYLAVFNSKLHFAANGGDGAGRELWAFIDDNIFPVVLSSSPSNGASIQPVSTLSVSFNKEMKHDGSAGAANNTANYLLLESGGDGFQTVSCLGGPHADDQVIPVNSAVYSSSPGGPYQASLAVNGGQTLQAGSYRLLVCGTTSMEDLAGNKLNQGLSDAVINFTIVKVSEADTPVPQTGFSPGKITSLPSQPLDSTYTQMETLWLEIPKLQVKVPIVGVPASADGWDVSWLGNDIGWLEGTAFPTWDGNAILTGHLYNYVGLPGVFVDLHTIKWGDRVVIRLAGQRYTFEVREVRQHVDSNAIDEISMHKEEPWLTLLTCQGYDDESGSYHWRMYARAVLIDVQ